MFTDRLVPKYSQFFIIIQKILKLSLALCGSAMSTVSVQSDFIRSPRHSYLKM